MYNSTLNYLAVLIQPFCYDSRTPLMHAVSNGHVDTVLYLIANGAIVNNHDIQGRTALHRGVSFSWNLKYFWAHLPVVLIFFNEVVKLRFG
jgi:ankyrin repeat protein